MPTIQMMWVEPPSTVQGWELEVSQAVLDRGQIDADVDEFHGPAGSYRLIQDEQWRAVQPDRQVPIFLHESYQAVLEKWVAPLTDAVDEPVIAGTVRNAVSQLADQRMEASPGSFLINHILTSPEPTGSGMAIVGRAVIICPTR